MTAFLLCVRVIPLDEVSNFFLVRERSFEADNDSRMTTCCLVDVCCGGFVAPDVIERSTINAVLLSASRIREARGSFERSISMDNFAFFLRLSFI